MAIEAPFPNIGYSVREVMTRYQRNGYNWDIHGTLYIPEIEVFPGKAIIMVHGGGVNETVFDRIPDKKPGWARMLASQGFRVLIISYPGLWPPNGRWPKKMSERKPFFLFDQEIGDQEFQDRFLKYTFNLVIQGIGILVDQNLAGYDIFAFGHSIGARLVIDLWRFIYKARIIGLLGFGSLGPRIWDDELQEIIFKETGIRLKEERQTLEELTRYWRILTSANEPRIFLPVLRTNSELEECVKLTGLPREEFFNNSLTNQPDKRWMANIKTLLLIGENDNMRYWPKDRPLELRPAYFHAKKFADTTRGTHLVLIPRYTHSGHLEPQSEKMTYLWLWAIKAGYFE